MDKNNVHYIKKQIIELTFHNEKMAIAFQNNFLDFYNKHILPILDEIFQEYDKGNQTIEIEKLELDLGEFADFNFTTIDSETRNKIKELLTEKISPLVKQETASGKKKHPSDDQLSILLHFLKTGQLRWWQQKPISIKELYQDLQEKNPVKLVESVFFTIREDENARKRFIYQFSDEIILKQFDSFPATIRKKIQSAYTEWTALNIKHVSLMKISPTIFRPMLWEAILNELEGISFTTGLERLQSVSFNPENVVSNVLDKIHPSNAANKNKYLQEIIQLIGTKTKNSFLKLLLKNIQVYKIRKGLEKTRKNEKEKEEFINKENTKDKKSSGKPKTPSSPVDEEESIFIQNSGLCLLWPYLNSFFEHLELVSKGNFINEECLHKAIALLNYLSGGPEEVEEHQLLFNKILCNVSIEEPLPLSLPLSENEKKEADDLLEAVISNWPVLKNTSKESFIESFIQREGALYGKPENEWLLRVEKKGLDVLMDSLPWGISMIKLPWRKKFLYVEW